MARKKNRRREQHSKRGRKSRPTASPDFNRVTFDTNYHHEEAFDGAWHVRQVAAWRAVKNYTCPGCLRIIPQGQTHVVAWRSDRKSTRLNSSHVAISYAVLCLKQ